MKMVESIRNNTVEKKQQKTNRYVNIHLEKEHEAGSVSLSDIVKKVILIVTDSLELPYSDLNVSILSCSFLYRAKNAYLIQQTAGFPAV